jgi:ABC-type multidrug transport system ATPase subunit
VTILLTTHVMEEAEELCGEIALLREGQLVAHESTGALTQSLQLARPITVTLRPGVQLPADWETAVSMLPGITAVSGHKAGDVAESLEDGYQQAPSARPSGPVFQVESVDVRASTPALLSWLRAQELALVSMRAEPVTLTDVFTALAGQPVQPTPSGGR